MVLRRRFSKVFHQPICDLYRNQVLYGKATQQGSKKDGMGKDHDRERAKIEVGPIEVTSTVRVEDMTNEDNSLEVEDQGNNLENYQLARDRTRRT